MNVTEFFSSNTYMFLPTSENPKVALAIDDSQLAKNSFKLYNPFSKKAKLLKKGSQMAFLKFNSISKKVLKTQKKERSGFVTYLEEKLDTPLVSSLYFATIADKVVMQLQTPDAKMVGYVKYPLNDIGLKHLETEKRAIEILSEKNIVSRYLLCDTFEEKPFLLLDALEGDIGEVERSSIDEIIAKFKREDSFTLAEHPRTVDIRKSLASNELAQYLSLLEKVCQSSTQKYALVYEHGDFTPWNIVKVNDEYIPFDFEHFVEDGLEYFDLIKYYYQVGKLLEGKTEKELIDYIGMQVKVGEINELLQLFLIKEIVRNKEENEPYDFEVTMLETLERL